MAATVIQMMPADGWIVVYDHGGGEIDEYPLACWMILKDSTQTPDYQLVGGYISDSTGKIALCENQPNFKTYKLRTRQVITGTQQ